MAMENDRLALVAQLAASYLRRNPVGLDQIATVVRNAAEALAEAQRQFGGQSEAAQAAGAAAPAEPAGAGPQEPAAPAVPVEQSVQRDYLVCLEDGQRVRTLKRHLRSAHGMTPQQYRARWALPRDYPMSAPAYSESRSAFAKARGLGRKAAEAPPAAAAAARPARATARTKPRRGRAKT